MRIWTPERLAYLREIAPGRSNETIKELVNARFGLQLTTAQIKSGKANHKIQSGLTGRFEPGRTSWNKGKKQTEFLSPEAIERSAKTRFKPGDRPINYRPIGSERVDSKDGYLVVKVQDHGRYQDRWQLKHRVVWEAANGPIPDNHAVIFMNGDRTDCRLENLKLIDRSTLVRLNQAGLNSSDPELMETSVLVAQLMSQIGKQRKRRNDKQ